jgi:hypothetical protein
MAHRQVMGAPGGFPRACEVLHAYMQPRGYYIAGGPVGGFIGGGELHWDYATGAWLNSLGDKPPHYRWYGTWEELEAAWPDAVRTWEAVRALWALQGT